MEFDKAQGLKSLVVKWGIPRALLAARLFHAFTILFFVEAGLAAHLGKFYFITIALIALAFIAENQMVRANDLSRVGAAFFTVNGLVGILFLAGTWLDIYLGV